MCACTSVDVHSSIHKYECCVNSYICMHTTPHPQLVHGYGFDASLLPSRGLLSRFSRPKKGDLEEMQGKLEEMLMTVVQKFEVPPMELLKFVEYPFTVSSTLCERFII